MVLRCFFQVNSFFTSSIQNDFFIAQFRKKVESKAEAKRFCGLLEILDFLDEESLDRTLNIRKNLIIGICGLILMQHYSAKK